MSPYLYKKDGQRQLPWLPSSALAFCVPWSKAKVRHAAKEPWPPGEPLVMLLAGLGLLRPQSLQHMQALEHNMLEEQLTPNLCCPRESPALPNPPKEEHSESLNTISLAPPRAEVKLRLNPALLWVSHAAAASCMSPHGAFHIPARSDPESRAQVPASSFPHRIRTR